MSSSEYLGFDNSFLHQTFSPTDQDRNSFETAREIQDRSDFLIQVHNKVIDETSSWEEVASLLLSSPPRKPRVVPELVNAECSVMEVSCYGSVGAFMQRNYGHNYLQTNENFPFGPHSFDRASESKNSINHFLGSICSNEEFQKEKRVAEFCRGKSSMAAEGNMKVGRYSVEERRERIDRYRAKRTLRNFNKTIKYACRKTLADGRQRIRGRFVRNDEILLCQHQCNLWIGDDSWVSQRR